METNNTMSVEELINILQSIDLAADIAETTEEEGVLNWGYIEDRHLLIQNAVYLANQVLILPCGKRDFKNESKVRVAGFYVSCLEQDSFGWLGGGIHTTKGVIAYG